MLSFELPTFSIAVSFYALDLRVDKSDYVDCTFSLYGNRWDIVPTGVKENSSLIYRSESSKSDSWSASWMILLSFLIYSFIFYTNFEL